MRRLLLSIILICLLTIPASAHPGGTDSSGGHYDHSTGEYHYHHGYGPHEHEDLDGDGDLDCPYELPKDTKTVSQQFVDGYNHGYQAGFNEGLTEGRREVLIWLIPISLSAVGVLIYLAWKGGE